MQGRAGRRSLVSGELDPSDPPSRFYGAYLCQEGTTHQSGAPQHETRPASKDVAGVWAPGCSWQGRGLQPGRPVAAETVRPKPRAVSSRVSTNASATRTNASSQHMGVIQFLLLRRAALGDHRARSRRRKACVASCSAGAWEDAVDQPPFLVSLHADILFDDGLSVAHLVENLAPCSDTMTGLAPIYFGGFLTDMQCTPEEITEGFSPIALRYGGLIGLVLSRAKSGPRTH